jgi:shikimate kinase
MSNIYLIGYRATGKTSVSNILAKKLNMKVIHMDDELINLNGPIELFVRNYGWNAFRDEESKLLSEISKKKNIIIDCGGGIIERQENIDLIKKNGTAILLKSDIKVIRKRLIKNDQNRPALTDNNTIDEVEVVLVQRKKKYENTADITINTNGSSIEEIANNIIDELI